jgi:hypothetical protein
MKILREIAHKYGHIDYTDDAGVTKFFKEVVPTLPETIISAMMDELVEAVGSNQDDGLPRTYEKDVPIPKLSESPPAPIPASAVKVSPSEMIFDFYEAKTLDSFARCECDYDLKEYNGKFAIAWDSWSDPPPFLLVYDDETEARQNFADLRDQKTDCWRLMESVKKEYQIEVRPLWADED